MSLKEKLLFEFEKNRDVTFSGQSLAQKFSVSRNAVWKAVQSLKEEGHKIESVPQKGYRLLSNSNVLSKEGVAQYITGELPLIKTYAWQDSANQEAKRLLAAQPLSNAIILTEQQSSGGEGQSKETEAKKSSPRKHDCLSMSLILAPHVKLDKALLLTSATAVAIVRAIRQLTDLRLDIQWVNDIFWQDKKISDILTEAVLDFESGLVKNVIVGVQLKLSLMQTEQSSLFINHNQLAACIYNELQSICQLVWHETESKADTFMQEYRSYSNIVGKRIGYQKENQTFCVIAEEILADGSLLIVYEDGSKEKIRSGDVWLLTSNQ